MASYTRSLKNRLGRVAIPVALLVSALTGYKLYQSPAQAAPISIPSSPVAIAAPLPISQSIAPSIQLSSTPPPIVAADIPAPLPSESANMALKEIQENATQYLDCVSVILTELDYKHRALTPELAFSKMCKIIGISKEHEIVWNPQDPSPEAIAAIACFARQYSGSSDQLFSSEEVSRYSDPLASLTESPEIPKMVGLPYPLDNLAF